MAGGNPVFDRLNKQIEKERYAGFGSPQGSPQQAQQGTQAATTGYAGQDAMTAQQLNEMYAQPPAGPADTGRVTVDDVVVKSITLFVVTIAVAFVSWFWTEANTDMTLPFWLGGMFGTLILGFVIAFMKKVSLLQVVLLMTGVIHGWGFGASGPLGIGLSILGVGLASYSLAVDFDSIDRAVQMGAPKKYSWLLAHGLIVSIVWLYIEFVRLFARLRD